MRRSGLAFVLYAALSCAVAVSVWEQVRPVAAERADQVRTTSEKALVRPNRIDELLRVLDDGDSVEIVHAGVALSLLLIDAPDNKRQTRVWLALRDGDASTLLDYLQKPDTRLVALKLVSALQTNNARFGPALIALVEDENPRVRETVAATLGVLDATPEIVRALFELTSDRSAYCEYYARHALRTLVHTQGLDVLPWKTINAHPPRHRAACAWAAKYHAAEDKKLLKYVRPLLGDPTAMVRFAATWTLGESRNAASAYPLLAIALDDEQADYRRRNAVRLLGSVDGFDRHDELLQVPDRLRRAQPAIDSPLAATAIPDLVRLLDNFLADDPVPVLAAETLGRMGPEARSIAGRLRHLSKEPSMRIACIDALERIDIDPLAELEYGRSEPQPHHQGVRQHSRKD